MKQWFAFELGPKGGISTAAVSSPLQSLEQAQDWVRNHYANGNRSGKVAIAEVVMTAERETIIPPIKFTEASSPLMQLAAE